MKEDSKNFIIFVVASMLLLFLYNRYFDQPHSQQPTTVNTPHLATKISSGTAKIQEEIAAEPEEEIKEVIIKSERLTGSLTTKGSIVENIYLEDYRENTNENSQKIHLLKQGTNCYNAKTGWNSSFTRVPTENTVWHLEGNAELSPEKTVAMTWDNGNGVLFEKTFSMDKDFVIRISQKVTNNTDKPIALQPYTRIIKEHIKDKNSSWATYEGPLGVFNNKLEEVSYDNIDDKNLVQLDSIGGWVGIADKYWLVAFLPEQNQHIHVKYYKKDSKFYIVDTYNDQMTISPGTSVEIYHNLFTGAKEIKKLDAYEESLNVKNFDLAIDFGYLYFITKPMLYLLVYAKDLVGNLGLAILLLTLLLKLLLFPLANKSYRSMNRMREIQPKIKAIQERYADDKIKQGQALSDFYKKEKVNPAGGCLPLLLQFPILFALYKVLYVSIDMRHAPFIGWIHDLSAPDPMYILNLFGLIPINLPSFLQIGIWPLLMGLSMFIQQKMTPQVGDPMQAKMMNYMMPVIFTCMLANLPSGLVIYWTWSNILGILQQYAIMKMDEKSKRKPT